MIQRYKPFDRGALFPLVGSPFRLGRGVRPDVGDGLLVNFDVPHFFASRSPVSTSLVVTNLAAPTIVAALVSAILNPVVPATAPKTVASNPVASISPPRIASCRILISPIRGAETLRISGRYPSVLSIVSNSIGPDKAPAV
jgi:hypothetical protein